MVAYSFQKRFVAPIRAGTKDQTIRADRKRHARPGEAVQLYQGMRTRHCSLIAAPQCLLVWPIRIYLGDAHIYLGDHLIRLRSDIDEFARRDGFRDWDDMAAFWLQHHPGVLVFSGVLIRWDRLDPAELAARPARGGGQMDLFEADARS